MAVAFASDFDGTLRFQNDDEPVSRRDLEAIAAFQGAGNLFGVATGRSLKGILLDIGDLIPFDFYIMATGALVLDRSRDVIFRACTEASLLVEINALFEPRGAKVIFHGNDTVYSLGEPMPMQTHVDDIAEIGPHLYGMSMWVGSEERCAEAAAEVNGRFGDDVKAYPNKSIVDIAPAGCSKGRAVALVKEHFGVGTSAAMGDSYNDIPMLRAADASFTFPDAPGDVRAAATHIAPSVADALEMLR